MAFLSPVALALLGLAGAVVAFHLIGRRGWRRTVPSAVFWRGLGVPSSGLAIARRRLGSLLLLLDVLAVVALAVAIARPALPTGPARNFVVLIDASASMQATDVRPSRFAEARRQAQALLAQLRAGDAATVLRVGTVATRVGSTADGATGLAGLVGALEPGAGRADFAGAADLARLALDPTRENRVVVLSDGQPGGTGSVSLPAAVQYRPIGGSDDNQAVTALAAPRSAPDGRPVAFARIANFASRPIEAPIRALADGAVFDARQVALPARGYVDLSFSLPRDVRLLEVRIERDDVLPLDNRAYSVLAPGGPVDVALVSGAPSYLERALRVRSDVRLQVVAPTAYRPDSTADVFVFDGFLPETLPPGNLLLVDPPPAAAADRLGLSLGGDLADPRVVRSAGDDPLMRGIDLSGVEVRRARRLGLPDWARSVVDAADGPLVARGDTGTRRVVALAFGLADTDLQFGPAFPLLLANAVDWLRPLAGPNQVPPDTLVPVSPPGGWEQLVARGPAGAIPLLRPVAGAPAILPVAGVGPYAVSARSPAGGSTDLALAANLLDERESDVAPAVEPPVRGVAPAPSSVRSYGEGWRAVALLGFLVLLAEWWWYHRGGKITRGP